MPRLLELLLALGSAVAQFNIETVNYPIRIYSQDELRIIVSNLKWILLVHENMPTLEYETNNRLLKIGTETVRSGYYSTIHRTML